MSQTKWGKENNVKLHRSRKEYGTIVISSDSSEDEELTENLYVASLAETSKCGIRPGCFQFHETQATASRLAN